MDESNLAIFTTGAATLDGLAARAKHAVMHWAISAFRKNQESLNPPFINGFFSSGFSRGNGPLGRNRRNGSLRSENGPLRRGYGPLGPWRWLAFQSASQWAVFGHPAMAENGPSKKAIER